jgi:hypothetical protein
VLSKNMEGYDQWSFSNHCNCTKGCLNNQGGHSVAIS